MDAKELLEEFDNDSELLLEVIEIFVDSVSDTIDMIKGDLASQNAKNLQLNAHTLKGHLRTFKASDLAEFAFKLETIGKESQFDAVPTDLDDFFEQLETFAEDLKKTAEGLGG